MFAVGSGSPTGSQVKNSFLQAKTAAKTMKERIDENLIKSSPRAKGHLEVSLSQKERKLVGLKKKPRYWTEEEDRLLATAVKAVEKDGNAKHTGDNMWKKVAAQVPNRAWRECLQRWTKVLVPGLKKGKWSPSEDNTLLALVNAQIKINPLKICWPEVSKGMGYRSCKQCRERWINHLDPNVKKGDWTPEEDDVLLRVGELYPSKWAKIARHIPGRTENTVKVRWKILKRQEWKPEEDRELLRLTAMYPRQWRTIACKLPGRNERNVKQRLHVLSKEKPEAFSFLQNLPLPKVYKKGSIGKKRSSPSKPGGSTARSKRRKTSFDEAEVNHAPDTSEDDLKLKEASRESTSTSSSELKEPSAPAIGTTGLDVLLQTATQATPNFSNLLSDQRPVKTVEENDATVLLPATTANQGHIARGGNLPASATRGTTNVCQIPNQSLSQPSSPTSPRLSPSNSFGLYGTPQLPYVVPTLGGAQILNQAALHAGLPLLNQMPPLLYNNPATTMAYMAALSAQLNSTQMTVLKQDAKVSSKTTSS